MQHTPDYGMHATAIEQRIAVLGARDPWRSYQSMRYVDPLGAMVGKACNAVLLNDMRLASDLCEELSGFVRDVSTEGTPSLAISQVLHLDIAARFVEASKQLERGEKAEMRGVGYYNQARAILQTFAADWLTRAELLNDARHAQAAE